MSHSFGLYGVEHGVLCHRCGLIAREVCRRTRLCERCYNKAERPPSMHVPAPPPLRKPAIGLQEV